MIFDRFPATSPTSWRPDRRPTPSGSWSACPSEPAANRYVVAVCSRMAPKDLARARRIAETRISRDAPGSVRTPSA